MCVGAKAFGSTVHRLALDSAEENTGRFELLESEGPTLEFTMWYLALVGTTSPQIWANRKT